MVGAIVQAAPRRSTPWLDPIGRGVVKGHRGPLSPAESLHSGHGRGGQCSQQLFVDDSGMVQ